MNYQEIIPQGIQLIQEWIDYQEQSNQEEIKDSEDFRELRRVIQEIQHDQDYSKNSFLDIQFLLRPFEEQISLKIKRLFDLSRMDHYTMFIASRWFETIEDFINLEMCTRRFQGNMTKFFYNPIALTLNTRKFFTHLQTLYIYSNNDYQFQNDSKIISREECKVKKYKLFKNHIEQLEEWTGLKCGDILFDSNVDNWSWKTSVLNERIIGKRNLSFVIEDNDREIFGYYLNTEVVEKYGLFNRHETDFKSFEFNLQSNERLPKPMKFEINNLNVGGIYLYSNSDQFTSIQLGDIILPKERNKYQSFCFPQKNSEVFNYYGIENALCGKTGKLCEGENFNLKRFIVIQME